MPTVKGLPVTEFRTDRSVIRPYTATLLLQWMEVGAERPAEANIIVLDSEVHANIFAGNATFGVDTVAHSITSLYVSQVSGLREVERIFWRREAPRSRIRVWTILNEPNEEVENLIAKAEMELMETLPEDEFDFSVIFRQDKPVEQIGPRGAVQVYPTA